VDKISKYQIWRSNRYHVILYQKLFSSSTRLTLTSNRIDAKRGSEYMARTLQERVQFLERGEVFLNITESFYCGAERIIKILSGTGKVGWISFPDWEKDGFLFEVIC
jgi:hypothetical protein